MSRRDWTAVAVAVLGLALTALGAAATGSFLREYGDVCGETGVLAQVWGTGVGGIALALVAACLAVAGVVARRTWLRVAAGCLAVVAAVAITVGGAVGLDAKRDLFERSPEVYGTCAGYNEAG